jgi:hypothetical protein
MGAAGEVMGRVSLVGCCISEPDMAVRVSVVRGHWLVQNIIEYRTRLSTGQGLCCKRMTRYVRVRRFVFCEEIRRILGFTIGR